MEEIRQYFNQTKKATHIWIWCYFLKLKKSRFFLVLPSTGLSRSAAPSRACPGLLPSSTRENGELRAGAFCLLLQVTQCQPDFQGTELMHNTAKRVIWAVCLSLDQTGLCNSALSPAQDSPQSLEIHLRFAFQEAAQGNTTHYSWSSWVRSLLFSKAPNEAFSFNQHHLLLPHIRMFPAPQSEKKLGTVCHMLSESIFEDSREVIANFQSCFMFPCETSN